MKTPVMLGSLVGSPHLQRGLKAVTLALIVVALAYEVVLDTSYFRNLPVETSWLKRTWVAAVLLLEICNVVLAFGLFTCSLIFPSASWDFGTGSAAHTALWTKDFFIKTVIQLWNLQRLSGLNSELVAEQEEPVVQLPPLGSVVADFPVSTTAKGTAVYAIIDSAFSLGHEEKEGKEHNGALTSSGTGLEGAEIAFGELLGAGSFGRVFRGTIVDTGQMVAIKVISHNAEALESVRRETAISMRVHHPNIVRTLHFYTTQAGGPGLPGTAPKATANIGGLTGWLTGSFGRSKAASLQSVLQSATGGSSNAGRIHGIITGATTTVPRRTTTHGTRRTGFKRPGAAPAAAGGVADAGAEGSGEDMCTCIIQEFCNQGTVKAMLGRKRQQAASAQAAAQGVAQAATASTSGAPAASTSGQHVMQLDEARLRCAVDAAKGLAYLHAERICHGDVKALNVLCHTDEVVEASTSGRPPPPAWSQTVSRMADFGLSRVLDSAATHLSTLSSGTVTHASPEVLMCGRLSPAADVYAFGVLLFELACREEPFPGLSAAEIIYKVVFEGRRPTFPTAVDASTSADPLLLAAYTQLAERCWVHNPAERPTMAALLGELEALLSGMGATKPKP